MFSKKQDQYQIRHEALLKARKLCGGTKKLAVFLGISRSRVSNWINMSHLHVSYEYLQDIANLTNISIELLAPGHPRNKHKLLRLKTPVANILLEDPQRLRETAGHRPIIIDTRCVLISGALRLERYKASGIQSVLVEPIDLEWLMLHPQEIERVATRYLLTERIEIALRLAQLFGNQQGCRTDLGGKSKKSEKKSAYGAQLRFDRNEVAWAGRKDEIIATIVGFSQTILHRAKKIYFHGVVELLEALNQNRISIDKAAKLAKLPKEEQVKQLELELLKTPLLKTSSHSQSTKEGYSHVEN